MKVLSVYDGIATAYQALKNIGINDVEYLAIENYLKASIIAGNNHSDIKHIGDINDIDINTFIQFNIKDVDLLICSPPYQNLKFNNDRLSSDCVDNKLFNKFIDILFTVKPKYFVLEHMTSMTTHNLYYISAVLNNIAPTLLDAKDFSAHRRERFFWVGKLNNEGKYEKVDLILPYGNSKMVLNDVLDFNYQPNKYRDISEMIPSSNVRMYNANYIRLGTIGKDGQGNRVYAPEGKAISLVANAGGAGPITGLYKINDKIRTLSCLECERLQGLPDGYTLGFKDTPRKRMLGNCSQVNLIEYVLKNIFN